MSIIRSIEQHGGLAATHELSARGHSRYQLASAVARAEIIRVRQGWYASAPATGMEHEAARVGGRLGCVSGAQFHGLWTRATGHLHVAVPAHSARLRTRHSPRVRLTAVSPSSTVVHWVRPNVGSSRFAEPVRECLRQMSLCQSPEWVVAAADSALRQGLISRSEWRADVDGAPQRLGQLLLRVDPRSESIIESVTRFRLQRLGVEPRVQIPVAGVGRVDLLIGRRLVIEVDGFEYHSDPERFEADRRRDARLSARGYRVLRFSYAQVMRHWSEVRASVLAAIVRGDHL
jgi:very-short-patch-repair endonuclease